MKFPALPCLLCATWFVTGCQTERTILAGPTVTGLDAKGLSDPKKQAAGFESNTGRGNDPSGYMQNGKDGDTVRGLNAMSDKMFGGKLDSQTQKEFKANKNFLTREYGGKKDFAAKAWKGAPQDRTWTDKLFDTEEGSEGDVTFRDAGRAATVKNNADASKMARTSTYNESDRTARTSNYRAAERALEAGRDDPKLTSAKADSMDNEQKAIHDRIANSEASASEINRFLGKP